jgi:hypothetical protein
MDTNKHEAKTNRVFPRLVFVAFVKYLFLRFTFAPLRLCVRFFFFSVGSSGQFGGQDVDVLDRRRFS